MKTITKLIIIVLYLNSISLAHITEDYPFKTYLDSSNFLYVAGFRQIGNTKDIYFAKYAPGFDPIPVWYHEIINPYGDDRGLDIVVDRNGNAFGTGYIYNIHTNSNDLILIAIQGNGIINWIDTIKNYGDDKGIGIEIKKNQSGNAEEVFITGYTTGQNNSKDFIIKKYSADHGDSLGQTICGSKLGDDIATDIQIDDNYAYVLGYSYLGPSRLNEIALLTFRLSDLSLQEALYDYRPGTDEKPTGFVIAERSNIPVQKSRIALTSNTENPVFGGENKFLTMYLAPTSGNTFNIKWFKE